MSLDTQTAAGARQILKHIEQRLSAMPEAAGTSPREGEAGKLRRQLSLAAERLQARGPGVCSHCGEPIGAARRVFKADATCCAWCDSLSAS